MVEEAAFLRDEVLPQGLPYRQWVLTVPLPLRFRIAKSPKLLAEVHSIFSREVRRWIVRHPDKKTEESQTVETGSLVFVQRFGSGLRLSPHYHLLAPKGGFRALSTGGVEFMQSHSPKAEDVCLVLERIQKKVIRRLQRLGILRQGDEVDCPVPANRWQCCPTYPTAPDLVAAV